MICSTFSNILWLTPSLTAYLSYLLQKKGCIRDYFTCLGEVNTYEKVESCPLSTKLLEKGSKLGASQFIEMHELLTIESHSWRPILYQWIWLSIWIKVISELFDDSRLTRRLFPKNKDHYLAGILVIIFSSRCQLPSCLLPERRFLDFLHIADHLIFKW